MGSTGAQLTPLLALLVECWDVAAVCQLASPWTADEHTANISFQIAALSIIRASHCGPRGKQS